MSERVFAIVEALATPTPPAPETVQRLTGIPLQVGPTPGNALYATHAGHRPDATPFSDVDMRVGPGGVLLVLTLRRDVEVAAAEVRARYGAEQNLSVPYPEQPATALLYIIYNRPGADLKFGFERPGMRRLASVIVDTIGKR